MSTVVVSPALRLSDSQPLVTTDENGLLLPGVVVVVDPDRADELGAFAEDALSLDDVLAAQDDE